MYSLRRGLVGISQVLQGASKLLLVVVGKVRVGNNDQGDARSHCSQDRACAYLIVLTMNV